MVLETEGSKVSKIRRAEGMVPNRLRKCRHLIYRHVDGIIVGFSIMSFENRHHLQVWNFFEKVVLSGCLAWQKLMAP